MDEKTLRRKDRQLRREQRKASTVVDIVATTKASTKAAAATSTKKKINLQTVFENSDIQNKILSLVIKNNSKVLNKEIINLIISQHTYIQYFYNIRKFDKYDKKNLLMANFGTIDKIIIDDFVFDINSVKILKYTIKHSPLISILLSNIRFTNDNVFSIFANIFNDEIEEDEMEGDKMEGDKIKRKGMIKHLMLKNIHMKKQHFEIFINSIGNLKYLSLLEISNIDIQNLFTPIRPYFDGFDFIFMKVLIKLKNLEDLIFTNNSINNMDYIYLFNEYYDFRHGYIMIDEEVFDGTYVKYNVIKEPGPDDEDQSKEYSMRILEINSEGKFEQCVKSQEIFYYTRGNYYKNKEKRKEELNDYIDNNFNNIINKLLTNLNKDNLDTIDIKPFMLSP